MLTKITSYTIHQTAEGMRATYTYSIIDENGDVIKSNQRGTIILLDETILSDAAEIQSFLLGKVPA